MLNGMMEYSREGNTMGKELTFLHYLLLPPPSPRF